MMGSPSIPDYGQFEGHHPVYTMVACQKNQNKKLDHLFIYSCILFIYLFQNVIRG